MQEHLLSNEKKDKKMILAPSQMQNNNGGNGTGYVPMRKKQQSQGIMTEIDEDYLQKLNALNDPRMSFRNSRDPVYVVFDYLQKQPVKKLAAEFLKELLRDSVSLISKVTK